MTIMMVNMKIEIMVLMIMMKNLPKLTKCASIPLLGMVSYSIWMVGILPGMVLPPKGFLPQKGFRCRGSAFTQIYIDSIYAAAGNKDIEIFIISECPFA